MTGTDFFLDLVQTLWGKKKTRRLVLRTHRLKQAVQCKYEWMNWSGALLLPSILRSVHAGAQTRWRTRANKQSFILSSYWKNCDVLIKIWQNVGGWNCGSLGERSGFRGSEALWWRRRRLRSVMMHNWHLHACANQSELVLLLFACDLISPADWHSFISILLYFFREVLNVGTSRLD